MVVSIAAVYLSHHSLQEPQLIPSGSQLGPVAGDAGLSDAERAELPSVASVAKDQMDGQADDRYESDAGMDGLADDGTESDDGGLSGACSEEEAAVLKPLFGLEKTVGGFASAGQTVYPARKAPCHAQPQELCYTKLGFTEVTAKCYADYDNALPKQCSVPCMRDTTNEACQECQIELVSARRSCMYNAMHISANCGKCLMTQQQKFNTQCSDMCAGSIVGGMVAASAECRRCNSQVEKKSYACFA